MDGIVKLFSHLYAHMLEFGITFLTFLDCGCRLMPDSSKVWCSSCFEKQTMCLILNLLVSITMPIIIGYVMHILFKAVKLAHAMVVQIPLTDDDAHWKINFKQFEKEEMYIIQIWITYLVTESIALTTSLAMPSRSSTDQLM